MSRILCVVAGVVGFVFLQLQVRLMAQSNNADGSKTASGVAAVEGPIVDISGVFRKLDKNQNGALTFEELKLLPTVVGDIRPAGQREFSLENLRIIFEQLDRDRNGRLSQTEFAEINRALRNFAGK